MPLTFTARGPKGNVPSAQPPTPATGQASLYVDNSIGSSDLPSREEPRAILPALIADSGVRSILARTQRYNYIRNSGFWFAQLYSASFLAVATPLTTTGRTIMFDGWGVTISDASQGATIARIVNPLDLNPPEVVRYRDPYYFARFNYFRNNAAAPNVPFRVMTTQVIEASDTCLLRGKTVRLQAQFQCSGAGADLTGAARPFVRMAIAKLSGGTPDTLPATFVSNFATDGAIPALGTNLSFITPRLVASSKGVIDRDSILFDPQGGYTALVASEPTQTVLGPWGPIASGIWDIPTDAQNLVVMFWLDRALQINTSARFVLSRVSLTIGEAPAEWTPQPLELELARCQRFACGSFNQQLTSLNVIFPLVDSGAGIAGSVRGVVNTTGTTAGQVLPIRFPVEMRAAPTITTFNPVTASSAVVRNTVNNTDASATATANIGTTGADVTFTGLGGGSRWNVGDAIAVHYIANAEI